MIQETQIELGIAANDVTRIDLRQLDCLDGLRSLTDGSIDVVVTSPPYNIDTKYRTYRDGGRREEYLDWSCAWGREICRVLKPAGSFFLNLGASPSNPLLPYQVVLRFSEFLVLQNTIHWIKSISIDLKHGSHFSRGHFKPIRSPKFLNDCQEFIFHFTKTGGVKIDRLSIGVPYQHKSNIKRWSHTQGRDRRCRGNTWFIPYKTIQSRDKQRPHPATFPVELAENCFRLHGLAPDTVALDPFLGLGSSAIAARNCGLQAFIGFEIDAYYVGLARERLRAGDDG
ncbi:MAG TPA: site-specific DNA-methyltransferase [Terrimicrobiaceae bacterium]